VEGGWSVEGMEQGGGGVARDATHLLEQVEGVEALDHARVAAGEVQPHALLLHLVWTIKQTSEGVGGVLREP
jgi:hypothetical protein